MTELADLADGLQHANLVVGRHDGDQNRLVVHGPLQVFEIDQSIGLHRQIGHAVAVLLQPLAGVQHRLVLGHLGDDVVAAFAVHLRNALDGQVVALGGAGGKDDLLGGCADQLGNLLARRLHGLLGLPSKGVVAAGRIAELGGEVGQHRLQNPRIQRAGGVIIHINRQAHARRHFNIAGNCTHLCSPSLSVLFSASSRRENTCSLQRQCNQPLRLVCAVPRAVRAPPDPEC